jgi:Flp pilus assembly protein CpaB
VSATSTTTLRRGGSGDVSQRRQRVPLGERLTAAQIVPAALAVLAAVIVIVALQNRTRTVTVPVASRAIAAGTPIDKSMLAIVSLPAGSPLAASVVPSASLGAGGWVAAVAIQPGDPISRSVVQRAAASAATFGSMSLTVPADHANGGNLAAGDRVDVIVAEAGQAQYVARGLSVISVASSSHTSGLNSSGPSSYYIVVAVDPPTALALTAALQSGTTGGQGLVEVVRTTGEANDNDSNLVPAAVGPTAGVNGGAGATTTTRPK